MAGGDRLPDFVVIGTMKSGTTSLYGWLGAHPDVDLPAAKEPHFFSRPEVWARGLSWYTGLFDATSREKLTGEFSVSYADPLYAGQAAQRLHAVAPHARLICVLREPRSRMRSHYMHEVRRSRERREFLDAIQDPAAPYVRCSMYAEGLRPWLDVFPREQLLVLTLDDLSPDVESGWRALLDHFGLRYVERRLPIANVTAGKAQFTPAMLWLFEHGLTGRLSRAPAPLRRMGRRLLLRRGPEDRSRRSRSAGSILPKCIEDRLTADSVLLCELLDRPSMPWDEPSRSGTEA